MIANYLGDIVCHKFRLFLEMQMHLMNWHEQVILEKRTSHIALASLWTEAFKRLRYSQLRKNNQNISIISIDFFDFIL
jgi:hypothetical protein